MLSSSSVSSMSAITTASASSPGIRSRGGAGDSRARTSSFGSHLGGQQVGGGGVVDNDSISIGQSSLISEAISEISNPSGRPADRSGGSPSSTKKVYSRYEPEDCDKFVHHAAIGDSSSIDAMQDMLRKRIVHPDSRHSNGNGWMGDFTALMVAALRNNVTVVEFLLAQTHPPIDVNLTSSDELGGTALILAAHQGNWHVCELLYNFGADDTMESNHRKLTALDWAYRQNHPLCIDILDGSKRKRAEIEQQRLDNIRLAQEAELARLAAIEAKRVAEERAVIMAANQEAVDKLWRFLNAACGIPGEFADIYVGKIYIDLKLPTVSRIIKRNKEKLLFQMLESIDMPVDHITAVLTRLNLDF